MSLVYISLGSNIGDGRANLVKAWRLLGTAKSITTLALSVPYITKPIIKAEWEKKGQEVSENLFTNAVGVLETSLDPRALLKTTSDIENKLGRDRDQTVNRTIDLDLIYYDDLILSDEHLTLPHPEMHKRHFVLTPLSDLAPDRIHPANGKSTMNMLRDLPYAEKDEICKAQWETPEDSK